METLHLKNGQTKFREKVYFGKKEIKGPYFSEKTDAIQWKIKWKLNQDLHKGVLIGDHSLSRTLSLAQYVNIFLEERVKGRLSEKTLQTYTSHFNNHILPFFKGVQLSQVTVLLVQKFVEHLKKQGKNNNAGINFIVKTLRTLFAYAYSQGVLPNNPLLNLTKLRTEIRREEFLEKSEIARVLKANADSPYLNIFLFAVNTGLRRGEIAGLCWDAVDFENNLIAVCRTRGADGTKNTTKTNQKRYVPMNEVVRDILLNLRLEALEANNGVLPMNGFVFLIQGKPFGVNHMYRIMKKMMKNAGITRNIRFHDLRHTFASHFVMNGGRLEDLQKILGHAKADMTARYAHLSPNYLRSMTQFMKFG